jgi:hypothetical protein
MSNADFAARDAELNDMILKGEILDAFEKFYAEDVVMEEGDQRREGKDENREYEKQFVGALTEFRSAEIHARAIDEDNRVTFSEWENDFTLEGVGDVLQKQVAVRTWNEDGQVTHEKFYTIGG